MPDGFDPHRELERIYNLRELMTECRMRVPKVLAIMDSMLEDDTLDSMSKLRLIDTVLDRGFGKARQHVSMNAEVTEKSVKVYIPANHREKKPTQTIDVEGNPEC